MFETEKRSAGSFARIRDTSVDFPEPDGAEMMKMVVTGFASYSSAKTLLKVQRLLPYSFDVRLNA